MRVNDEECQQFFKKYLIVASKNNCLTRERNLTARYNRVVFDNFLIIERLIYRDKKLLFLPEKRMSF